VESAVELRFVQLPKEFSIELALDPKCGTMMLDSTRISQVLLTGIMQQRSPFSKIRPYFPSSAVLPTEKSTKSAKRCHFGHPFHLKSRCIGGFLHFGAQ
jgi:hypothetical protein